MTDHDEDLRFDDAADAVVDLGNRLLDDTPETDPRAIADGLIAGAVHYWLYAHQPEAPVPAEDDLTTARERLEELVRQIMQSAEESEYLHSPQDSDVGTA